MSGYLRHRPYGGGGSGMMPPLPPFEASDSSGLVHTTLPPELQVPSGPTREFVVGDAWGITLPVDPMSVPLVPGCNTTPRNMIMSYLLPWYRQNGAEWVIDSYLAEFARRYYSHLHFDRTNAVAALGNDGGAAFVREMSERVPFVTLWASGSSDDRSRGWTSIGAAITNFLNALLAGANPDKFFVSPGEELNNGCPPGPAGADSIIQGVLNICSPLGIPTALHFTSYYPGYPENAPPDQFDAAMVAWLAKVRGWGVRQLWWQADPNASAGMQGAKLYDARRFWQRAGFAYPAVAAFELVGEKQLYGQCDEPHGALRGWELMCCPAGTAIYPVAGTGGGIWCPDGRPFLGSQG